MYINDITESITSDIRLFADDCILYRCISSIGDCVALQHDIDTLLAWSNTWKMHFNPSKCQVMSVTRQRKRLPFVYRLGEVVLPCVTSFNNIFRFALEFTYRYGYGQGHSHTKPNQAKPI